MVGALLTGASVRIRIVNTVKAESSRLVSKIVERGGSHQTTQERRRCLTVVSSMRSCWEDADERLTVSVKYPQR